MGKLNKVFRTKLVVLLFLMGSVFGSTDTYAQCAMCKAAAEADIKEEANSYGKSLNKGILYLLAIPYAMGGVALYIWYKHRKAYRD